MSKAMGMREWEGSACHACDHGETGRMIHRGERSCWPRNEFAIPRIPSATDESGTALRGYPETTLGKTIYLLDS
jgi:hypothetical protein